MPNHIRLRTRLLSTLPHVSDKVAGAVPVALLGDSIVQQNTVYNKGGGNYLTAVTKAATPQFTRATHALAVGDEVFHWGVKSMTQVNEQVGTVSSVPDANNYVLSGPDTTAASTFSGSSGQGYAMAGAAVQVGLNPAGFFGNLNFIMGQRFDFSIRDNRGITSETSTNILDRLPQSLPAGRGTKLVIMEPGTNDASNGISLALYQSNIAAIRSYVHTTLGARLCVCTITPKNADTNAAKDLRDSYNAWLRTLASTVSGQEVYVAECHDAVASAGTRANWISGYDNGDGVHPAQRGAWAMAQALKTALLPAYGYGEWTMNPGNLLLNPALTGTGGTVTGGGVFVNSGAASNWSFAHVGTVEASRTVSKNGSDQQVLALNSGSGKLSAEGVSVTQAVAAGGLTAGGWYVAEGLVALDGFTGTNNLTRFELSLLTGSAVKSRALGTLAGTPVAGFADAAMVTQSSQKTLHFKTPAAKFLASEANGLSVQFRLQANCVTYGATISARVIGMQLYPVTNPFS